SAGCEGDWQVSDLRFSVLAKFLGAEDASHNKRLQLTSKPLRGLAAPEPQRQVSLQTEPQKSYSEGGRITSRQKKEDFMAGTYDIITVGGGLGGSALARAMAARGARVLVLEHEKQFKDRV